MICISVQAWSWFRLSVRRLWNDLNSNKRHNTPHSNRYEVSRYKMYLSAYIYTKVSVVPIVLLFENFHIFWQGLAKNTFTICNVIRSRPKDKTKVKNVFNPDNTHIGYCVPGYDTIPFRFFVSFSICINLRFIEVYWYSCNRIRLGFYIILNYGSCWYCLTYKTKIPHQNRCFDRVLDSQYWLRI